EKKIATAKDDDPGNPTIDFRGEKRTNDTHQSTTDPECVLYKKSAGDKAKLCFGAHVLMENRNGFCAEITLHNPIQETEPQVAIKQADAHQALHQGVKIKSIGADKNYHQKTFVKECRQRRMAPHVSCKAGIKVEGLDGRTTGSKGCQTSLKLRKRVEEIFGW